MPVIVMLPGIAAFVLYKNGHLALTDGRKDYAYSAVLGFLPAGLKELVHCGPDGGYRVFSRR